MIAINKNQIPTLPGGWIRCPLTTICDINPGKLINQDITDTTQVSFIPMKCIESLSGRINLSITRPYTQVKKGYTHFCNGDILFAKITPSMENGKIAIANNLQSGVGVGSTEFHVIRIKDARISNKFYFYYFLQKSFRQDAQKHMTGTAGQLRVPASYLKNIWVPVPPFAEQKRIVHKIELIFSHIDTAQNCLIKTNAFLKQVMESILQSAFEGRLLPQCSSNEPASILLKKLQTYHTQNPQQEYLKSVVPSRHCSRVKLPIGWARATLGEISLVTPGQSPPSSSYNQKQIGLPFFQGKADFGYLYPTTRYWCNEPLKTATKNDILISVRAPVGPTNLCRKTCCIGRGLSSIRVYPNIHFKYVLYHLRALEKTIDASGAGTTFKAITSKQLKSIVLNIAPYVEQKQIVTKIESLFSKIGLVSKSVESSMSHLGRLKNSTLKKAFTGALVQQNSRDTPVTILPPQATQNDRLMKQLTTGGITIAK